MNCIDAKAIVLDELEKLPRGGFEWLESSKCFTGFKFKFRFRSKRCEFWIPTRASADEQEKVIRAVVRTSGERLIDEFKRKDARGRRAIR